MANINLKDGNGITFSLSTSGNTLTIQIDNAELNSIIQTFLNDSDSNLAKALNAITDSIAALNTRVTALEDWKDDTATKIFTSNGLTTTSTLTALVNTINGTNSTAGSFRKAVKDLEDDLEDGTITVKNATNATNATTAGQAKKLINNDGSDVAVGGSSKPVYFINGKPAAISYGINKTVPSDAKFTDTTYTLGSFGITATADELNQLIGHKHTVDQISDLRIGGNAKNTDKIHIKY